MNYVPGRWCTDTSFTISRSCCINFTSKRLPEETLTPRQDKRGSRTGWQFFSAAYLHSLCSHIVTSVIFQDTKSWIAGGKRDSTSSSDAVQTEYNHSHSWRSSQPTPQAPVVFGCVNPTSVLHTSFAPPQKSSCHYNSKPQHEHMQLG